MNKYQDRQNEKKARYEELAQKFEKEGEEIHSHAKRMAQAIPFGQPILVGHHSERRDRNYRERIHKKFGKSFEILEKADHYKAKAAAVGKGGISSDDPEAIEKLQIQLSRAEKQQKLMKSANAFIRKNNHGGLKNLGFSDGRIAELFKPDFAGRTGFPDYELTNNNANIRRIKKRIELLEKNSVMENKTEITDRYVYREDVEENRIMFEFEGKPSESIRSILKSHGFKWSPTRMAWVRQLNNSGRWAAQAVKSELQLNVNEV